MSKQDVAFGFRYENKNCSIFAVYASTNHINRRNLWEDLTKVNVVNFPWCIVGDYNAFIGSHEHRVFHTPSRAPMKEFKDWGDNNNLMEIHAKGSFYTWYNGRTGLASIERKLDKYFANTDWYNLCYSPQYTVIPRFQSDHHPLLLEFSFNKIRFKSQFRFFAMLSLHDSCQSLVVDYWSTLLVGCPRWILTKKTSTSQGPS